MHIRGKSPPACRTGRYLNMGLFVLLFVLLCDTANSATLKKILFSEKGNKLRLVLYTDVPVKYGIKKGNSFATLTLPGTKIAPAVKSRIKSSILDSLTISSKNNDCVVAASFKYLTSCNVFALKGPNRIVADYARLSKMSLPTIALPKIVSPEVQKIATSSSAEKFKILIYLTSFVPYRISTAEGGIIMELPDTISALKSRKIDTRDKLIPKVAIDVVGNSVLISASQNYPSFYQIYKAENPSCLVIEFDKTSKSTIAAKEIRPGLSYVKFVKGTEQGPGIVNALIIDQSSLEVFPYMSKKKEEAPNFFSAIGSVFTFWMPKEETRYIKDRVSNMVKDAKAIAGVNGTFFGKAGEPLGVLMINSELVSYSIYDRTALIIDGKKDCYIDNFALYGESSIEGIKVQVAGINEKRQAGETIAYTPRFGKETSEDGPGIILSVIGDEVKNISRTRGWIPPDGYAISLDPSYYEALKDKIRIGTRVHTSLKLIPLSGLSNIDIKHVIGGGPRLMKAGQIYISKNSERFQSDIAKSRAARTAVGITKDGLLAFATVDKCQKGPDREKSVGVTLEELAQIMKELGCVDAMNLDGGSSSTMVLSSEVINSPSGGSEKAVSNGILIR